jgi:hypothetical protein
MSESAGSLKMFQVRPFEPKTLLWWLDEADDIDFSPVYQRRGKVWTDKDKAYLIDSILNEYDIPKFYLADFTYVSTSLNHAGKKFAVIDGKQRFEAIRDFYEGRLTLDADFVWARDPSVSLGGLSYRDLKANYPKIASRFDNFSISVMSVITDDEAKINELFVRLNNSKPLTGSEVRNAMLGPVPDLIRQIAEHTFFKDRVRFKVNRMQGHNSAGKLLLIEHRGRLVDTKKAILDKFVEEGIKAENPDFNRAAQRVVAVLDRMDRIFVMNDPLLGSQGPVTPYYWLVRNANERDDDSIREFIVKFEERRKKRKTLTGSIELSQDLATFESMNRNTNDQGSLNARYSILRRWLDRFLLDRNSFS